MTRVLIAAAMLTAPLLASQPAAAETIYPWCLYDTRGATNCGFVSEQQCRWSKTANADYCGPNGLYDRVHANRPPYYGPKRHRYYR